MYDGAGVESQLRAGAMAGLAAVATGTKDLGHPVTIVVEQPTVKLLIEVFDRFW